jgi:hypothetical protein
MMYETDDKTARQIDLKLMKAVGDSAGVPKEWVGIESVEISNSSASSDASGDGAGEGEAEEGADGDGGGEGDRRLESDGSVKVGYTVAVPYPAALPKLPFGKTPLPSDLNKLAGGEEVEPETEAAAGTVNGVGGESTDGMTEGSNLVIILVGLFVVVAGFAGICCFIRSTKSQRHEDSGGMNQVCNNESEGTNEWLSEMIGAANSEFSFSETPELQAERV